MKKQMGGKEISLDMMGYMIRLRDTWGNLRNVISVVIQKVKFIIGQTKITNIEENYQIINVFV